MAAAAAVTVHLLLVLIGALPYCNAEFTEYPSNITLPFGSGTDAVFRCRHSTANDIIWMVNGLLHRNFPEDILPHSTIDYNGTVVYTLTIPARVQYSGTDVVCVAIFLDGSVPRTLKTPPVILTVLAEKPTTEPTPMLSIMDFIQIPSPSMVVIAPENEYTFYCNHSQTTTISWKLNGTTYNFVDLPPDINFGSESIPGGSRVYTLTFRGFLKYNRTIIQCVAELNGISVETSTATLLIQGPLQSVVDLARNVNTISWVAPFSLDLTGVDPDIVYCVEVYNITCGRSLLISECDVVETNYTIDALLPGHIYEYTITPRSNVEGASNGTSINVTEEFVVLEESLIGHSVAMMKSSNTMNDLETRAIVHLEVHDHDVAIRPALYSIFFNSLDGVETHPNFSEASTFANKKDFVVLEIAPLSFRRLWSIRVYAHNCEYHPLTDELELGTHDFHNITIISPSYNPGTIMVTGDIIPGSTSIGILVIVYSESLGSDSNIHYNMIEYTKVRQPRMYPVMTGLPVDEYKVAVFVVEEDGKPFPRAAATLRTVRINGIQRSSPANIEYEIQPNSAGVCVNCTFLDSAATGCVVVVHQRISQLGSSGLMNITESHKFIKSGNDAYIYGCIGRVDMRKQQVGVIGGVRKTVINSKESHSDQCSTLCLAVVTAPIAIALILVLSIIIFTFVYISRKRKTNRLIQQIAVSMQQTAMSDDILEPDTRYETVQLSVRTQYGHSQDEMDANSTISPPTVSGEGPPLDSAPSLPPPRSRDTDPVYTEAIGSKKVTQQPTTEGIVYDDIKAFQN